MTGDTMPGIGGWEEKKQLLGFKKKKKSKKQLLISKAAKKISKGWASNWFQPTAAQANGTKELQKYTVEVGGVEISILVL